MRTGRPAAGWYPDPNALHEWRWWDGVRWRNAICDGGVAANDELDDSTALRKPSVPLKPGTSVPPPPQPTPVASASLAEKLRFVLYLAILFVGPPVVNLGGVGAIVVRFAVLIAFFLYIFGKLGYRSRDVLMILIPVWGQYIEIKLAWRLACLPRHYWAPAPA